MEEKNIQNLSENDQTGSDSSMQQHDAKAKYMQTDFNAEIAVFALNYYLMENGFTPINMPVKRDQYCTMVADCLKGKNQEVFYNFLVRAVYDKMEGTIDACIEYLKNNQPAE